jgi:hypothetical protein
MRPKSAADACVSGEQYDRDLSHFYIDLADLSCGQENGRLDGTRRTTSEQVIREMTKFQNGVGSAYEWDDFLTIPIHDHRLNATRIEGLHLRDSDPPSEKPQYCSDERLKRIEEILSDLKADELRSQLLPDT